MCIHCSSLLHPGAGASRWQSAKFCQQKCLSVFAVKHSYKPSLLLPCHPLGCLSGIVSENKV